MAYEHSTITFKVMIIFNIVLIRSRILVCNSVINTCCFGPGGSNFVFGGTQDGSVQLWDLREPNSMHKEIEYKRGTVVETVTVRYPTYSTDILINDNHKAEIVSAKSSL